MNEYLKGFEQLPKLNNPSDKFILEYFKKRTDNDEQSELLWLRWKCRNDLYFLGTEILGLKDAKDGAGRYRLDPKFHIPMVKILSREEDTLQLYPRGSMKTTWTYIWIIQKIIRNPYVRIGYWSKTSSLVKDSLRAIKNLLCNEKLMEIFPDIILPKDNWQQDTESKLIVFREPANFIPKESQIEAWGIESSVTGRHYDYHVYDDIIDRDNVTSALQIDKVREWWSMMQAIKDAPAIEKIIGTIYHPYDIYNTILSENMFYKKNIAIIPAERDGKITYKYYTRKFLNKMKKTMGDHLYSCQFLNKPIASADRIFIPPYPIYTDLPEKIKNYITVDPAVSINKTSCQTCICVAAVDIDKPNKLYFREAFGVKLTPDKLAELIVNKIFQYRPKRVGIEFGLQEGLRYLIDIKLKEEEDKRKESGYTRPVFIPIPLGREKKSDKIDKTIGAFVRDHRALFLPTMTDIFKQMSNYSVNSDKNDCDIIDAAGMMIQTVEHFSLGHYVENFQQPDTLWDFIQKQLRGKSKGNWDKKMRC